MHPRAEKPGNVLIDFNHFHAFFTVLSKTTICDNFFQFLETYLENAISSPEILG